MFCKKPPAKVMALVKEEKATWITFRKDLKAAKAKGMKETLELVVIGNSGE